MRLRTFGHSSSLLELFRTNSSTERSCKMESKRNHGRQNEMLSLQYARNIEELLIKFPDFYEACQPDYSKIFTIDDSQTEEETEGVPYSSVDTKEVSQQASCLAKISTSFGDASKHREATTSEPTASKAPS